MEFADTVVEQSAPQGQQVEDQPSRQTGAETKPNGKARDEAGDLRKQLAAQARRIEELEQSERYWAGRAQNGRGQEPEPEAEDEQTPETDVLESVFGKGEIPENVDPNKVVDDFAAGGVGALRKYGITTREDIANFLRAYHKIQEERIDRRIEEKIAGERRKISVDAEIMHEFPELQDEKSELFAETSKRMKAAVRRNPAAARDPNTIFLAAEAAREYLRSQGKVRRRGEEDEFEEEEDDRTVRIRAQQGDRGRRRSGGDMEDTDLIGPETKSIIARMGVSEDEFRSFSEQQPRRRRAR